MRCALLARSFATLLLAACASLPGAPVRDVALDAPFEIHAGEAVRVSDSRLTVTVTSIAASRCPSEVICISAGEALVALQLSGGSAARTDTLRMLMAPHDSRYDAYHIELVDVRPFPRSTDRERVSVAVLRVSRAE